MCWSAFEAPVTGDPDLSCSGLTVSSDFLLANWEMAVVAELGVLRRVGSYEKVLKRSNKLMMECLGKESEEEEVEDSDDDLEEDNIEVQEENSDTEQEISDTEIEPTANLPYFLGKDKKTKW
ncbi:hypothetical protein JTB14_023325 [Gonioctena quinquepunctata]|nr:hypothetical protein JTB14_023325 [Gonioctena quinquepunctata]